MARNVHRLLHSFCVQPPRRAASASWQPAADVYQLADGWLIKFELAGVQTGDIELTLSPHGLTISGMRRDVHVQSVGRVHAMEISYNRFERTIELPGELEHMQIATEYRDGMLLVRLIDHGNQGAPS